MSRHLFGRPAKQLNLAECALIAGLARAPSTLSPWSNLDGALARSHVVLARMREEGFITRVAGARGACGRASGSGRIRAPRDPRGGYAKEYLRQLFRERFGGDHPPDWEVRTTFVPALQEAAEQAVRARARPVSTARAAGGARRDRSADRQHPRARRRPRLRSSRSSTAPAAAGGSRARRSSRCSTPPRSSSGYSPVSIDRGADEHRAAGARRVGAAQRRRRRRRTC